MEKNNLMTIVLAVLVLVAAVQAYQLSGLGDKVDDGSISSGSVTAKATTTSTRSNAVLPSSLDNLPNMVGGC